MNTHFCHTRSRIRKHLKLGLSYCLSLASVLAISAEAMAQPLPQSNLTSAQTQTAQAPTGPTEAESTALRLQPSYNLSATEGAGHDGFASFGGFFPLFQTPRENVTFLEGRVSVDTNGDFGGGLQAGYRSLLNDSTIWGAYAGVDVRDTGDNTFTQSGIGTELLGENWDLILNANIPLGDAREVISSDAQAANPRFTGNQLLIDEQQVNQVQAALTTVSLDAGLELFDFGERSSLWGRSGVYFLGGEASEDSLGVRASLDYRATNSLRFGVGVQNDGVFGTNATFSVNASLGSRSRRSYSAEENSTQNPAAENSQLWARAAEPIARTSTVLVENQTEVKLLQAGVAAINPDTENAFVFRHVDPGVARPIVLEAAELAPAREGTFEDPFTTISQAANISDANADNIIFVQEGNAGGAFTLPDGVQVRSVGPIQQLNTQFGEVVLPGSGSGNLPIVTGTATIGNNTLVSGLEINPAAREIEEVLRPIEVLAVREAVNGIVARGENITIEDNVITNVDRGINLPDIDGTVNIVRNQISNAPIDGISFGNIDETDNTTITVANNTLDAIGNGKNGRGIEFGLIEGEATADITVSDNQVSNVQDDNIFFSDIQGSANATIAVSQNLLEGGSNGVEFNNIEDNANANITISDNQINNIQFEGIDFFDIENSADVTLLIENNQVTSGQTSIDLGNIENAASADITIAGNTLTSEKRGGIFVNEIEDDTVSSIRIEENTILGAGEEGIEFRFIEDNANATISILNNQISDTKKEGIFFEDIENEATVNITVSGNTITDVGDDGIEFNRIEDSATVTATVTNNTIINAENDGINFTEIVENAEVTVTVADNTINNPGDNGVSVEHTSGDDLCLALDNNTVIEAGGDGFELQSNGKGQFQVVDLANVTTRNVGTFNPNNIETNDDFVNGEAGVAPCR